MSNSFDPKSDSFLHPELENRSIINELIINNPNPVYILRENGTCIFQNQAMQDLTKDYNGKTIGVNLLSLDGIKVSGIAEGFMRCINGETVKLKNISFYYEVIDKELNADITLIPFCNGKINTVIALFKVFSSSSNTVLEKRIDKLEAERDFSYTLLNNTPIAIFAFDTTGKIFNANKAVAQILGDENIDFVGQNAFNQKVLISNRLPYLLERSAKGTPFSGELHILYKETNIDMVLDFQITPIFREDDIVDYVIVMFADVTEKFYIRKSLQDDLLLARKIQKSIIPEKDPEDVTEINFFIHYQPMGEVGGDFYDISTVMPGKKIRILVTDATGHGVQGALTTMLIKSEYEKVKIFDLPPNRVLDIVNNNFCALYPNMRIYFTCFIADIDLNEGIMQYSSAGHPGQFLMRGEEIFTLSCRGRFLGIFEKSEYELKEINIVKDDRLFLFTDGLFEEFSDSDEIFGHENLKNVIKQSWHHDLTQHSRNIIMDIFSFKGWRDINDDITFIVANIDELYNKQ